MKRVSIIIPVKNEEKTIGNLLNKINSIELNQINFEKEIIVIDDGSDDNTSKILDTVASTRFQILSYTSTSRIHILRNTG